MQEKNKFHPIYERLLDLCAENNLKITPLCLEITGFRGNLDTWKKGNIRNDYLIKLSEKFNVSTDYLLCKTDDPTPPDKKNSPAHDAELSEDIKKLLEITKDLTDADIELLINQADFLLSRQDK